MHASYLSFLTLQDLDLDSPRRIKAHNPRRPSSRSPSNSAGSAGEQGDGEAPLPLKYKRIRAERQAPLSEDQKTRRRYAMLFAQALCKPHWYRFGYIIVYCRSAVSARRLGAAHGWPTFLSNLCLHSNTNPPSSSGNPACWLLQVPAALLPALLPFTLPEEEHLQAARQAAVSIPLAAGVRARATPSASRQPTINACSCL